MQKLRIQLCCKQKHQKRTFDDKEPLDLSTKCWCLEKMFKNL